MKKFSYLFLFFFISSYSYAQDFKEKIKVDVCKCLGQAESPTINTLQNCLGVSLAQYEEEFKKLIDTTSSLSEYEQGRIIGRKLFTEMQADLIHSCDAYYEFWAGQRKAMLQEISGVRNQKFIDSISPIIQKNQTPDLLWERGLAYFAAGKIDLAKKDFEAALAINPNHFQSKFFLAWTFEKNKEYAKAISLYEELKSITQKNEFAVFVEMAKRQSKSKQD